MAREELTIFKEAGVGAISPLRQRIRDIAAEHTVAAPWGKVSDKVLDSGGNRAGWPLLKQFFDEAVVGWTPDKWDAANLRGVQKPGERVPQPHTGGVQWCGIFATWVAKKAGAKQANWILGTGVDGLTKVSSFANIRPGDICVVKGPANHHVICHRAFDSWMETVEGNAEFQSIKFGKRKFQEEILLYYSID